MNQGYIVVVVEGGQVHVTVVMLFKTSKTDIS